MRPPSTTESDRRCSFYDEDDSDLSDTAASGFPHSPMSPISLGPPGSPDTFAASARFAASATSFLSSETGIFAARRMFSSTEDEKDNFNASANDEDQDRSAISEDEKNLGDPLPNSDSDSSVNQQAITIDENLYNAILNACFPAEKIGALCFGTTEDGQILKSCYDQFKQDYAAAFTGPTRRSAEFLDELMEEFGEENEFDTFIDRV
jgi:hypothetical protein